MQKRSLIALAAAHLVVAASAHAQSPSVAPNAPSDKPVGANDCQWVAVQKAIAPMVAQAKKSFPEARRKFAERQAPVRPMFITTVIADSAQHREQIFVHVDSISGSRIAGRVASQVGLVKGYRYGQPIAVNETELMDWMFANPDGSEEGNVVGKFMDTYTPPAVCRAGQ